VPQPLADAGQQTASWNDEGVILFKASLQGGVARTTATGESPTLVTTLDATRHETNHSWPYFLPDGRHFLFLALSTRPEHDSVVYAASLDSSELMAIARSDSNVAYVPPGYLVYMLGNTLVAQPFDADRLRVTGDPVPIADEVERNPDSRRGAFSVSQNGVLAYRPIGNTELAWFDRTGQKLQTIGAPGRYANPALSPDGRRVAVARMDPDTGTNDVWLLESAPGAETRVTFDAASDDMPVWSRDGRELAFRSNRGQTFAFYRKTVGASTLETLWLKPAGLGPSLTPFGWTPDARYFTYTAARDPTPGRRSEIWLQPMFGDGAPRSYLDTSFNVLQAQVSPDGRWLAYASNESGRNEVYVRPFPDGDDKWQVSTGGGIEPEWRSDGKELFFLAANQDLMALAIKSGTIADAVRPARLFRTELSSGSVISAYTRNQYVVTSDGQRFLINQGAAPPPPITVVVNWTAALAQ
jgi:dipeptidyl aminopeptidase/acylaminoacyl peptidase